MRILLVSPPCVGDPDLVEQINRACLRISARGAVDPANLGDLPADGVDWIEMGERVLEHHRDASTIELLALNARHGEDALPSEAHIA